MLVVSVVSVVEGAVMSLVVITLLVVSLIVDVVVGLLGIK